MIVRRFFIAVTAATLVVGSCGGDPPPPPPAPPGPDMDSLRAYQDSVREAEEEARRLAAEEAARRAEEATRERARQRASRTLQQMVFFEYDMSEIRDDAASALRAKVDILRASPQVQLRIEGHADDRGSTEYNLALGNRRAVAVRDFLTGFGISESRFSVVSFGEERPLESGSDESAWSRNRRGQFVITAGENAINPGN